MLNHTHQDFILNVFMKSAAESKHVDTNDCLDEAGYGRMAFSRSNDGSLSLIPSISIFVYFDFFFGHSFLHRPD